jgi:hypothetical protein
MRPIVPLSLHPGDWMTVSFGRYAGIDGQVLEVQELPPLVVRARLRVDFDENVWQPVWKEPMTEAEWLTTRDTAAMERYLFALKPPPSERKWRLFGCACSRQVLPLIPESRWTQSIEWLEYFADSPRAPRERFERLMSELEHCLVGSSFYSYRYHILNLMEVLQTCGDLLPDWPGEVRRLTARIANPHSSAHAQRQLLRDIMGNPFRQHEMNPSWLAWQDGQVVQLAELIYNKHQWNDLTILADALEDAGCTDDTILSHCRTPGLHARGCWLLDGLLGKK